MRQQNKRFVSTHGCRVFKWIEKLNDNRLTEYFSKLFPYLEMEWSGNPPIDVTAT